MNDTEIIRLYQERTETAISETARKYGAYLYTVAFNIIQDRNDAEEIVNDTSGGMECDPAGKSDGSAALSLADHPQPCV